MSKSKSVSGADGKDNDEHRDGNEQKIRESETMSDTQPPVVGRNIMNYRKMRNMSLDELSKRSGVSKSMLSQIEQMKTNPTVITVWKIARALETSLENLVETEGETDIEVVRSMDATVIYSDDKSCKIKINSPVHLSDTLELYHMQFKPYGSLSSTPHYPKAEEFLTVISGKIKVISGNFEVMLNSGDTARYRADRPHKIENLADQEAEVYMVVVFPK